MPNTEGFAEEPQQFETESENLVSVGYARLKIDSAGRIVIPAEMRAAMMVKPGDAVTAQVVEGEFQGFRDDERSPWIIIRAVDSSAYDVLAEDDRIVERIRRSFRNVNEISA